MKNTVVTICLLLCTFIVHSQSTIDNEIIGSWKVKRVVKASNDPRVKEVVNGFAGATFTFDRNHFFSIVTTNKSEVFKMVTDMTNGKYWMIQSNSIIAIGSEKEYVMKIEYKIENNSTIFTISETDIILEVEKMY